MKTIEDDSEARMPDDIRVTARMSKDSCIMSAVHT